ncbi:helix-turn-helix domain-containing protein [Olsenella uli]|mgnify:CR=1 FL=1|uniref:helix-turn-helix domain-containing protein n=1 Tax=Olsenella uli TaxID=133926 RepID=UPI0028E93347|nr:helix-turn-helix domain-containing protein [Olsenella uli]
MAGEIFGLQRTAAIGANASKGKTYGNERASHENAGAMKRGSAAPTTAGAHDQGDALLDVSQVAEYLRISRSSVYKLIERQQIPAIRIGRLLRVRRAELDEALHALGTGV